MKIILKKDDPNLGSAGAVVSVKDGYARNFLIPQGIAVKADKSNLKQLEELKKTAEMRLGKDQRLAEKIAEKLSAVSITAKVKTGEDDKLFGSVTSQDIADLLKEKGYEIDRRKIELEEPIRELGVFQVPVKLHPQVEARVKLWVIKE